MNGVLRANCRHEDYEPVEMSLAAFGVDETVLTAQLCRSCLRVLDPAWGCEDCEFREAIVPVRTFLGIKYHVVNVRPCRRHQEAR